MFRSLGKSKIALLLAILFGISLFFFRGGSRYSNIFNSDNVVAKVSNTTISTTKFNRTLQMNINQFSQILGQKITKEEIETFQIHSLALNALISDAIFENEYDKNDFVVDEKIIAKKTKERIPQLYDDKNKLNQDYLNQFLQKQQLKIEDLVQIINYETRDQYFNDSFFNVNYPQNISDIIHKYDDHKRRIEFLILPFDKIALEESILSDASSNKDILEEFYSNNLENYMSEEKRDVNYVLIDKKDYLNNFYPTDFEILEYFENNKELFFENEKRSFIQFNFKNMDDAKTFKNNISDLNTLSEIIKYSEKNNIKFNSFEKLYENDLLKEISEVVFSLNINEQSNIINTEISNHIVVLKNVELGRQPDINEVENKIKETISSIETNNYLTKINEEITNRIIDGNSIEDIAKEFDLKIKKINDLTKNYENEDIEFFNSFIPNVFSANKDFVNDIVTLNLEKFYFFNVLDIKQSKPIELNMIKEIVFKDWQNFKKTENIQNLFQENINNKNFLKNLSLQYNEKLDEVSIDINSNYLPVKLKKQLFKESIGINVLNIEKDKIFIANVSDVIIPENIQNKENINLIEGLRSSFGNEIIKNVKISTNDSLINAVIKRY